MYYAVRPSRDTPEPFCEIRAFIFTDKKPTEEELEKYKEQLDDVIRRTLMAFPSIGIAESYLSVYHRDEMEIDTIRVKPSMEIRGFEVEMVDLDEVLEYFRGVKKTLKFNKPYRYARFYSPEGEIRKEYDEWDIDKILKRMWWV